MSLPTPENGVEYTKLESLEVDMHHHMKGIQGSILPANTVAKYVMSILGLSTINKRNKEHCKWSK